MSDLKRNALLLKLIEQMKSRGSWCGETHIQKSVYFLQELLDVPLDFEYVLYKYGPYSFGLTECIEILRADHLIKLHLMPYPYGPSLEPGEGYSTLLQRFPKTLSKYDSQIAFVAKKIANNKVSELEKLATALYVIKENSEASDKEKAHIIHNIKPHVSFEDALLAISMIEKLQSEAQTLVS